MKLECKACGKEVKMEAGKPVRSCEHKEAGIVANMTAKCYGRGKAR